MSSINYVVVPLFNEVERFQVEYWRDIVQHSDIEVLFVNDGSSDGTSKLHHDDGPAVEYYFGDKEWWANGKVHREDGPAVEHANGNKAWFVNGFRHREDGPAFETINGSNEWWFNGKKYTEDEFVLLQFTNRKIVCPTQ